MEANQDEETRCADSMSLMPRRTRVCAMSGGRLRSANDAGISTRRGSSQRVTLLIDLNQHPSAFAINHNGMITRYQGFTDV